MFINLQATFRQAYYFGRQLAQLLFDNFPGMDKLAKGFTELFNPAKFRKMFDEILGAFRTFFTAAQTDPKAGMQTLMKNIVKIFGDTFGGAGGALEKIKEGFKTIMSILGVVFGELLKKLMELATEGIKNLIDLITGKAKIDTSGATSIADSFFGPIKDALIEQGPALGDAFIELINVAFEKLKPHLIEIAKVLAIAWTIQFAISLAMQLAIEFAKKAFVNMLTNQAATAAGSAATTFMGAIKGRLTNLVGMIPGGGMGLARMAGPVALGIAVAKGLYDGIKDGFESNKTGPAAVLDGVQGFGASVLSSATLGLVSKDQIKSAGESVGEFIFKYHPVTVLANVVTGGALHKKMDEATKKEKEMGEQIANSQRISAEGIKQALEEGQETTKRLYEDAVKRGDLESAVSYAAQVQARAKGLDPTSLEFQKERDILKRTVRERVEKEIAEAAKVEAEKVAAALKEANDPDKLFMDALTKAQETATKIEELSILQEKLTAAKSKFAALDPGRLEKDLNEILPKYTRAMEIVSTFAVTVASEQKGEQANLKKIFYEAQENVGAMAKLATDMVTFAGMAGKLAKISPALMNSSAMLENVAEISKNIMSKYASTDGSTLGGKSIATDISDFVSGVKTANDSFSNIDVKKTGFATFVQNLSKMGKIEVNHNLPNAQVTINVSLNAKDVAHAIAPQLIRVDLSKDTNKPQRLAVEPGGSERPGLISSP
jgi:hypothetical protein